VHQESAIVLSQIENKNILLTGFTKSGKNQSVYASTYTHSYLQHSIKVRLAELRLTVLLKTKTFCSQVQKITPELWAPLTVGYYCLDL